MGFDWKAIIKTAAPFLGTALGGPLGGAAGKLIAIALGSDETKATPDDLAKLVQNVTPEQLLALKNADQAYALQLRALNINEVKDLEALAVQDRESARNREVQTKDSITPRLLAGAIVFGFLWCVYYVLSGRVQGLKDPGIAVTIGSLIGYVSAKADTVYGYYFGGSIGETRKTELLHQSTPIPKEQA